MRKIYTSIDIGSDTTKIVVGESFNNKINVLAAKSFKSKGIRKGLIVDSNLVVNTIKDEIKDINDFLGYDIKKVIVGVPEYNVKFMYVTGKIIVDGIIDTDSINKVIKDAVYNKIDKDYELVNVIPIDFIIDDEDNNFYPIGKECKTLSVKGIMITVPKKNIYSVVGVIEACGLEVVDITISGIADYYQVHNKKIDNKIGAIINFGHETTNISIINNGILMNTDTLQLGGINIENDIAYVFNTNIIDARIIKEKFATAHKRFTNLNEVYELKNNIGEIVKLNQLEVTEVVMSRLTEIFNLVKKQILLLTKKDLDYIIITGGLTEIKSFKNLVYEIFGKDVIIYLMDEVGIRDNKYISAMGMLKYFDNKMLVRGRDYSMITQEDEELLLTPEDKRKKDKMGMARMFNFMKNKEEK